MRTRQNHEMTSGQAPAFVRQLRSTDVPALSPVASDVRHLPAIRALPLHWAWALGVACSAADWWTGAGWTSWRGGARRCRSPATILGASSCNGAPAAWRGAPSSEVPSTRPATHLGVTSKSSSLARSPFPFMATRERLFMRLRTPRGRRRQLGAPAAQHTCQRDVHCLLQREPQRQRGRRAALRWRPAQPRCGAAINDDGHHLTDPASSSNVVARR